ncbi:lachesin-like [Pollicipes pollicipes]|uniref:lachesin-like n=1 Tax=Pollicipes pollicipes TaxID=41117 RepID=UPI001884AF1A|nr:lachesin-like [Pollicipes pollicipes]
MCRPGAPAFLPCPAAASGRDSPVWVRRKDYHILTGGKVNYITDKRFQGLFDPDTADWTLQIKCVTTSDNGTYECQVSSGSGYVSRFVRLHVFQPVATIPSGPEYHVQQGSTIQLVCVVDKSPTPPNFVFWYHGDVMINYDKHRGGISVDTESKEKTFSRLTITDATLEDSGNYSCKPSNTDPASVHVYVSQGDKMAAIQRKTSGGASLLRNARCWLLCLAASVIRAYPFSVTR